MQMPAVMEQMRTSVTSVTTQIFFISLLIHASSGAWNRIVTKSASLMWRCFSERILSYRPILQTHMVTVHGKMLTVGEAYFCVATGSENRKKSLEIDRTNNKNQ